MLLGVGVTSKSDLLGNPVITVEYHRCDRCDREFKVYFKNKKDLSEALSELAKKLIENGKEDLCLNCLYPVEAEQMAMALEGSEVTE